MFTISSRNSSWNNASTVIKAERGNLVLQTHGFAKEFAKKNPGFRILTCMHGFYITICDSLIFYNFLLFALQMNGSYLERVAAKILEFADLAVMITSGKNWRSGSDPGSSGSVENC